ncbi:MAG TPA: hypothetical protein VGL05_02560 [Kribbella sp.]
MAVDEPRNHQPTTTVDRFVTVQPDPDLDDPLTLQDDVRRTHLTGKDVEDRTRVQQQPMRHPGILPTAGITRRGGGRP